MANEPGVTDEELAASFQGYPADLLKRSWEANQVKPAKWCGRGLEGFTRPELIAMVHYAGGMIIREREMSRLDHEAMTMFVSAARRGAGGGKVV